MEVPLTVLDFLDRAETVFADREAVVDEPDPPGGGLGRLTYGELATKARSLAVALDEVRSLRSAAQRFDAQGAGACEQVQHGAEQRLTRLQHREDGAADQVRRRSRGRRPRTQQRPAPRLSRDHAHCFGNA